MQSVLGSRRPNCIILDEIDGAMGGSNSDESHHDNNTGNDAIQALLKIVNAKKSVKKKGGVNGEGKEEQQVSNIAIPHHTMPHHTTSHHPHGQHRCDD